jgi:hypothetical protein
MAEATLLLGNSTFTLPRDQLIEKCELFQTNADLTSSPYRVKSFIQPAVLSVFIDAITGKNITLHPQNVLGLSPLSGEFGFWGFSSILSSFATTEFNRDCGNCAAQARKETINQICELETEIERQVRRLAQLEVQQSELSDIKERFSQMRSDMCCFRSDFEAKLQHLFDSARRLSTLPPDVRKSLTVPTSPDSCRFWLNSQITTVFPPTLEKFVPMRDQFKVILVGGCSGKTCLLLRLTRDTFDPHTPRTLAPVYEQHTVQLDTKKIQLQI